MQSHLRNAHHPCARGKKYHRDETRHGQGICSHRKQSLLQSQNQDVVWQCKGYIAESGQ